MPGRAMQDVSPGLGVVYAVVVRDIVVAARDGSPACGVLDNNFSSCDAAGVFATSAPADAAAACMCGAGMVDQYSSCAVYIESTAPTDTDAFSVASEAWDLCSETGGGGARATATAEPPVTSAFAAGGGSSGDDSAPAGCSSVLETYSSCSSAIATFDAAPLSQVAACFCYDNSGTYGTTFDGYAGECATWVSTADPTDYAVMAALSTFCDDFAPETATNAAGSTVTRAGSGSGGSAALPTAEGGVLGGLGALGSGGGGGSGVTTTGGSAVAGASGTKTTKQAGASTASPVSWVGLVLGVMAAVAGLL